MEPLFKDRAGRAREDRAKQAALEESLFVETLRMGHRGRLQAFGWSMWPQIWPGDTVTLEPAPFLAPALAPGDMVLAMSGGCLRLQRGITFEDDGVVLKGDAVMDDDPECSRAEVLGRVVSV